MLALVWATKYFRCYLYGRPFLVTTDHSALSYLRKFSNNKTCSMRWSLNSGLDFVVEHRPGVKIPHADALSKHVGLVKCEASLDKQSIRPEQQIDALYSILEAGAYDSTQKFFLDEHNVLYRHHPDSKHQIILPRTMVKVIRQHHDPVYASHPGVKRTLVLVSLNYWRRPMRKDIAEYVRMCDSCQRRKEDLEFTAPLGEVDEPSAPFQVTSLDMTGLYPLTP
jgi:hypothetical protein